MGTSFFLFFLSQKSHLIKIGVKTGLFKVTRYQVIFIRKVAVVKKALRSFHNLIVETIQKNEKCKQHLIFTLLAPL